MSLAGIETGFEFLTIVASSTPRTSSQDAGLISTDPTSTGSFPTVDPWLLPTGMTFPIPPPSYSPNEVAAYIIGSVFLLLTIGIVFMSIRGRTYVYVGGAFATVLFFIAYIVRGAMSSTNLDIFGLYKASIALEAIGVAFLTLVNFVITAFWIEHISASKPMPNVIIGIGALYAVVVIIIHPIGIVNAFSAYEHVRLSASDTLLASYCLTLIFNVVLAFITLFYVLYDTKREFIAHITNIIVPALLISTWASYHIAAVTLSPENVTHTSELMFYLLDTLPLLLVCIMWIIFNAPRLFNFEEKYWYSNDARSFGHKYPPKIYTPNDRHPNDPERLHSNYQYQTSDNHHHHHHHHHSSRNSDTTHVNIHFETSSDGHYHSNEEKINMAMRQYM
ncbi:hypothetical protein EV182_005648 [Spiromyces aspiralis]|uniref:Uncharacterized protein n=1 Tax=Spiromyces aspiralis TaxID=68401 RepID=A0ACC1HMG6_9FUNG|nr:hypothetical protein EV182_005648 [Spiromyces aspiralis]